MHKPPTCGTSYLNTYDTGPRTDGAGFGFDRAIREARVPGSYRHRRREQTHAHAQERDEKPLPRRTWPVRRRATTQRRRERICRTMDDGMARCGKGISTVLDCRDVRGEPTIDRKGCWNF